MKQFRKGFVVFLSWLYILYIAWMETWTMQQHHSQVELDGPVWAPHNYSNSINLVILCLTGKKPNKKWFWYWLNFVCGRLHGMAFVFLNMPVLVLRFTDSVSERERLRDCVYAGFFHACLTLSGEWFSLTSPVRRITPFSTHSGFLLNEHIQMASFFFTRDVVKDCNITNTKTHLGPLQHKEDF